MTDEYDTYIDRVLAEVPDADREAVREEFTKYHVQFRIEPEDAVRSIMKRFQKDDTDATIQTRMDSMVSSKKVEKFSELASDDRNVTVEVAVVTYTPRMQKMKTGEEKQIAFGWIEDLPFSNEESTRWDYKDWGNHSANLSPGSIVRLEGVSVNEWNGKRSLNINQSSRVVVLQEGNAVALPTSDPVDLSTASTMEGPVSLVARVVAARPDQIVKKDGSGTIDVVRGRLADSSGQMSFLCWGEFNHEVGALLRFEGANIRRFRDTPEVNFSDRTKIEVFRDAAFPDVDELASQTRASIADIRDGMRGVDITVQIESIETRTFVRDGEERSLTSVRVLDPSGRCKMTVWSPIELESGQVVSVQEARIRAFQGTPDITVDDAAQITILDDSPWEKIDPESHVVEATLGELRINGSRDGIQTEGDVLAIRDDCGIVLRCPECRRVLREGVCADHNVVEGVEDLRLRLVIDDGLATANVVVGRAASEKFLESDMSTIQSRITEEGASGFVQELQNRLFGQRLSIKGRAIVDDRGTMLMADSIVEKSGDPVAIAAEVRERWGVVL
ncbi:MAG: hypothetical protein QGH13_02080 [Candidatus Thalassarchaeaceae archaeon]|nr:hypothetical protein [Candidatus Thalassarchaeaceae archaeon]